jgi:uncharacterized protein YjbI with pentapeptide repeats
MRGWARGLITLALLLVAQAAAATPARDCQTALGPLYDGSEESDLPGQIDGATLDGGAALVALRRVRGDALLTIKGGRFAGANFRGARLHNICFLDSDLSGSDWRGAQAPGVGFVRSNLAGATLAEARLDRILIRNSDLSNVHGERASLAGGRLDGGWFDGKLDDFRLDGANLSGFRFDCGIMLDDGCPVYTAQGEFSLRGANLSGANLYFSARIDGARIDRTEVEPGQLHMLGTARIRGPILLRGGDNVVEISAADHRALRPHLPAAVLVAPDPAPPPRAPPLWVRPGAAALFVDTPAMFDAAFRETALYRRLLPALIGASSSRVLVTVGPDGRLDAAGDAYGANGHSCSLGGEGLSFDPATGYYSGPHQPSPDDPPAWRGRPEPVLMLAGDTALVYRNGRSFGADNEHPAGDYASCGARASFGAMVRVPVSEAELNRLRGEVGVQ